MGQKVEWEASAGHGLKGIVRCQLLALGSQARLLLSSDELLTDLWAFGRQRISVCV